MTVKSKRENQSFRKHLKNIKPHEGGGVGWIYLERKSAGSCAQAEALSIIAYFSPLLPEL